MNRSASLRLSFGIILLASSLESPASLRETKTGKLPRPGEEPTRPEPGTPPPSKAQRIFGIGVGFERSGTLSGVALFTVLPDSPAFRAGLVVGCIISEINGQSTAGRTGDECAQLIRDGTAVVRMKFLDPAMKERTITLEKEWLAVPPR